MTLLSLHNLRPAKGSRRTPKRVGRGNASGKGTTAGRGTKGQKARTGGRNKLKLIGMRRIVMATPKLRGFRSQYPKRSAVDLDAIAAAFGDGAAINPKTLAKKGLIPSASARVKILAGSGKPKKLAVSRCEISAGAKDQILTAGGTIK